MSRAALIDKTFNNLCKFLGTLHQFRLQDQRDNGTKKFVSWCHKHHLPVCEGDPMPKGLEEKDKRAAIRACFIAMPSPICEQLDEETLSSIDALLADELQAAQVVDPMTLPQVGPNVAIWQGDMSILAAEAVVNPANGILLGCFLPTHKCLDNILHAQAGPRLRVACAKMKEQLKIHDDDNGQCRVTEAFSLPAKYVFHTVGPNLVEYNRRGEPLPPRKPTNVDRAELTSCYTTCLDTALELGVKSLAFCCISTGVFGYPSDEAAQLALMTTQEWMNRNAGKAVPLVIFNVFLDKDLHVYQKVAPTVFGEAKPTPSKKEEKEEAAPAAAETATEPTEEEKKSD